MSKIDPENYINVQDCKILKACQWKNSDTEIPFDVEVCVSPQSRANGLVAYFDYHGGRYFIGFDNWIVWDEWGSDYIEIFTDEDFRRLNDIESAQYQTKFFELRDYMTRIPIMCVYCNPALMKGQEKQIVKSAGYLDFPSVLTVDLNNGIVEMPRGRTYGAACPYIAEHWFELVSGQVIDVRFILGESEVPCESDFK